MANVLWERFELVAKERAGDPAIFYDDRVISFSDLLRSAQAIAEQMSVAPAARVLVCARNAPDLVAHIAAIWRCGAIPVMLGAETPCGHVSHALGVTLPDLIVTDHELPQTNGIPVRRIDQIQSEGTSESAGSRAGDLSGSDPASIIFTSGSTGMPKGVTQAAENLLSGVDRISTLMGYRPDDRILCPVPFSFDYGWGHLQSLLLGGVALVLPFPRNAFGLCDALQRHAPTVLAGVPSVFSDLISGLSPIQTTPRGSVRLVTNTGSKIPKRTYEEILDLFPAALISLNYGLTETYRSASLPVELARSHPDSVGSAVPGVELFVLRPDGSVAAPGEQGEIIHRGAGVFMGYWNDPERTAAVLKQDPVLGPAAPKVVFTGDIGHKTADGLLCIKGRRDRQIKSMGVRVSPDEVEMLLSRNPLISEAAVVSVPNEMMGDMITACIVLDAKHAKAAPECALEKITLNPAQALKKIKAEARETMSAYMQPRRYEVLEAMPRTTSGKIDYPALTAAVSEA